MPPAPPGEKHRAQSTKIPNLPAGYGYTHPPLPRAQCFNDDTYGKDSEEDEHFIPDSWNDEGTSTG